jgi:hypothetical protein
MLSMTPGPRQTGSLRGGVLVGVLSTLTMDAAFLAASRAGGARFTSDKVGVELVGRWAAGLARGRQRHEDLAAEPPVRGEAGIGLAVHQLTGILLTLAYQEALTRSARRPGVGSGAVYGAATALLPLLLMYPSWGLGPFGLRSGECAKLVRLMLIGHTVFGAAIGMWSRILLARADAGA